MNLLDLQILFQEKITDVNPIFDQEKRPDTYTIVNYLNRSIMDYLKKGFMSLPTFEQQLVAVSQAQDDLRFLIRSEALIEFTTQLLNSNWDGRGYKHRLPDDMLIPLNVSCTASRIEVQPYTSQKVFAEFRSRKQAEKLLSTPTDKVIHVKPVAFIEDEFYLVVVGDAYTIALSVDHLTYLRKPDKLSFDYTELTGDPSSLDITTVPNGSYMRMLTLGVYVNIAGQPANYRAGDKVLKVAGYNSIFDVNAEPPKIGYPWGYTNTPDFPEYLHEDILERATQLFLEEANLKLIPKES